MRWCRKRERAGAAERRLPAEPERSEGTVVDTDVGRISRGCGNDDETRPGRRRALGGRPATRARFARALLAALGGALAAPTVAAAEPLSPHAFLEQLCDDFGGRMTGTSNNARAMERLAEMLRALGYEPDRSEFTMPGWVRGEDRADLLAPVARPLRVAALSYTQPHAAFEAEVVDVRNGTPEDFPNRDVTGCIGLLGAGSPLMMNEVVANAQARGLRAVLFTDREGGGQLLARTGSFSGTPLPLPVYSLAQEHGLQMKRLLARGVPVRVRLETKSHVEPTRTANLSIQIRGEQSSRVIVGAHFDSWDLGQGAMDNGIGIAELYALALALRGQKPHHTVELIWFNGEEQGLFGSLHAAAQLGETPVVAMINLDMVGVPIGVNALGSDTLVPVLERWHRSRGDDRRLPKGVENINWAASDHTPYQLAGVRTVTFDAPIPRESVRYYHDFADTIDKVPAKLIDDASAIVLEVVQTLAGDATLTPVRHAPAETKALFTRFGLERRLRGMGLWTFGP